MLDLDVEILKCMYPVSRVKIFVLFMCLKLWSSTEGFWLLAGDVQSSTAKIIGRKYLLPDATRPDGPTLVSVALLDLSPEEQESKSAEGQRMMDRG